MTETAKSIDWCMKIRRIYSQNNQTKSEYHQIYKLYIEGTNLKRFSEIKKQDYVTEFISQISISRNYKEIADLLSKNRNKSISNEDFDKRVGNYESIVNCKIGFKEEKEIIDTLRKTRNELVHSFEAATKSKANVNEYERILNEMEKFPIKINFLKDKIISILAETQALQREIKRNGENI